LTGGSGWDDVRLILGNVCESALYNDTRFITFTFVAVVVAAISELILASGFYMRLQIPIPSIWLSYIHVVKRK
jgi:hypothetical protein